MNNNINNHILMITNISNSECGLLDINRYHNYIDYINYTPNLSTSLIKPILISVFEPSDEIMIYDISIVNISKMPTPYKSFIVVNPTINNLSDTSNEELKLLTI